MKPVIDIILDNLKSIKSMVESGSTDKEIVEFLGIGITTWKKYKAECLELKAILIEAKDFKNEQVEQSLFKLCNGFNYVEEVPTKLKKEVKHDDGTITVEEEVKISKVKKYCKPDLNAQKFWLNNKKSNQWRDDPNKVKNDKELLKLKKKELESKEW